MSAPGHKMVLKEIYEWFEKNTNKSKNSDSKGWQNSIRHNLSMNAVSMQFDHIPENHDCFKDDLLGDDRIRGGCDRNRQGKKRKWGECQPSHSAGISDV